MLYHRPIVEAAGRSFAWWLTHFVYKINASYSDRMVDVFEQGCFVLANHQKWVDLVFEGQAIYDAFDCHPLYIMRDTLPFQDLFAAAGGVPMTRQRDLPERLANDKPVHRPRDVFPYLVEHVKDRGVVVIHPEGTRHPEQGVDTEKCMMALTHYSRKASIRPWYVPLNITYDRGILGSRVKLDFGTPLKTEQVDTLLKHMQDQIPLLHT